jgi:hypothetical protein
MVSAEEVTPKGGRYNDKSKGLAAIAHRLHGDELPIDDAHAVVAEERAVGLLILLREAVVQGVLFVRQSRMKLVSGSLEYAVSQSIGVAGRSAW